MTFKPNRAGIAAFETAVRRSEVGWAERIAERAREIAPVLTGTYRDNIRVEHDGEDVGVLAGAPYSIFVEIGTSDTPAFAPLTRAVDASARDVKAAFRSQGIDAEFGGV